MINGIEITGIYVFLKKENNEIEKAFVRIELNDSLVLNGIRIVKGQFGHFVSYPGDENTPFKFIDFMSLSLRKKLQNYILQEYCKELSKELI